MCPLLIDKILLVLLNTILHVLLVHLLLSCSFHLHCYTVFDLINIFVSLVSLFVSLPFLITMLNASSPEWLQYNSVALLHSMPSAPDSVVESIM